MSEDIYKILRKNKGLQELSDKEISDLSNKLITRTEEKIPISHISLKVLNELLEKIRNDTLSSEDAQELDFIINEFDNEFSDITIDFDNTEVEE